MTKLTKEYVIWGCNKDNPQETLLLTKYENKNITDEQTAKNLVKILGAKYGCYNIRIQTIDLSDNKIVDSFIKTVNRQ
jgi:hypothetical protein